MRQGEVYWHTFRPPDKRRPILILTRTKAIAFLTGITLAPLTTRIRDIDSEVLLTADEDGVLEDCAVNVDSIQTVQKSSIGEFITVLSVEKMREVYDAIAFALGFDAVE